MLSFSVLFYVYLLVAFCSTGLFKCKSSSICISHTNVCDGVKHCPADGEDEKYCGDIGKGGGVDGGHMLCYWVRSPCC